MINKMPFEVRLPYKVTEEEEQQILILRAAGYSPNDIAREVKLSSSKVYIVCRNNGVSRIISKDMEIKYKIAKEIRQRYCNGEKYSDLRIEYNLSGTNLTQILKNELYHDKDYNPQCNPNNKNAVVTVQIIHEMRQKYDAGEAIYNIIDEYRHLYKSGANRCIRQICLRQSYKNIK